jgi:hypothetical protein
MTYRKDLESAHLRIAALETTLREKAVPAPVPPPAAAPAPAVAPATAPARVVRWLDAWPVLSLVLSAAAFVFAHDFAVWCRLPELIVYGTLASAVAGSALLTLELALGRRRGGVVSRALWVLAALLGGPAALVALFFLVEIGLPIVIVVGSVAGVISGTWYLVSWVRHGSAASAREAPEEPVSVPQSGSK